MLNPMALFWPMVHWPMAPGPMVLGPMVRAILLLGVACSASGPAAAADWITESNRHAQLLSEITARYNPEGAAGLGIEGHDADVIDLKPMTSERQEADLLEAERQLELIAKSATDPRVRQDLEILGMSAQNSRQSLMLNRQLMVPYFDLPQTAFEGFQKLLHEGVAKGRQAQGLRRLHRYVGAEAGYQPITLLARARLVDAFADAALVAPWTTEVQESLENEPRYIDGIRDLFRKSGLKGWQSDLKTLSAQFDDYDQWLKTELLPRARQTNLLPEAIYADNLKVYGVDEDPRELMQAALSAFAEIREEMSALAKLVAQEKGFASSAYTDVLRELKKDRIPEDRLLEVYEARLTAIEEIVRTRHLASLPARAAVIRLATPAESSATPAPHIDVPRLIGNTGQRAEFVIPTSNPNAHSGADFDDFSFDAITWTLTAHEARPGHELQLATMLEEGVSTARALYAFNSANVEGWALYAEAFMKPYFPLEAQLAGLQHRLLRSSRAFLDPMLNLGLIEPAAAKQVLMREVCLSEPMAKQEVDRYTFRAPGQATSYFFGYQKLEATRAKAEIALGDRFDLLSYHDFILRQGLLPLRLLDKAVMEDYVPSRRQ